jgi:hypothetical protein
MRTNAQNMGGSCKTFQKRIIASGLLALLGFGGVFSQTRPSQAIKSAVGPPPEKPVDVGKQIIFSTMNVVGERCAMIYGGPSLGAKDFIIQDCGGPRWTNRWNFSGGYVKAMSFVDDRSGWFVVGRGLLKVEKLDWGLQGTVVRNEPDENIENVFFASQQYGCICG